MDYESIEQVNIGNRTKDFSVFRVRGKNNFWPIQSENVKNILKFLNFQISKRINCQKKFSTREVTIMKKKICSNIFDFFQ